MKKNKGVLHISTNVSVTDPHTSYSSTYNQLVHVYIRMQLMYLIKVFLLYC